MQGIILYFLRGVIELKKLQLGADFLGVSENNCVLFLGVCKSAISFCIFNDTHIDINKQLQSSSSILINRKHKKNF